MGEAPATYAHADRVAELTKRIRRTYPQALAWATSQTTALHQAMDRSGRDADWDAMYAFVVAHQHLTNTELAHLDDRDTIANDVLTAALHIASGIDWFALSITVHQLDDGRWRVATYTGNYLHDVPVTAPDATMPATTPGTGGSA